MRRHLMFALASSASLALLAAAGCSSTAGDDRHSPEPDAGGSPDASDPPPVADASTDADASPKPDAGPHAAGWDPSFSLPGVAGRVNPTISAMARIGNRQIALAGNFEQAGSIPTKFVALWNGNQWLSIGAGLPSAIDKMVATPDGELFGAVEKDGKSALYKWDKTAWSEVAELDGWVSSLDVDDDGTLYVAGAFTHVGALPIENVAKLTGTTWEQVPNAPSEVQVVRVVGTKLCVGGGLDQVGVQCLEDGTWQRKDFGPEASGSISDITEHDGDLVVGGWFGLSWSEIGGSLARWNGAEWELIGGGLEGLGSANVRDVEVDGDKIYVAGSILFAGGTQVSHVAMWDAVANRWSSLNDGIFGASGGVGIAAPAEVLVRDQGGEIYVGGRFSMIGGRNALGIARWDGNQWNPVDDPKAKRLGINGPVNDLVETPDGVLYAGGLFQFVGGDVAAGNIARFENDAWSPLGAGLDNAVLAIAVSGKTVYAGGDFLRSGPVLTRHVAMWNGVSWSGLGHGLDGPVRALAIGPDGNVYAGGDFTESGGTVVNHIAKWNGSTWQPIGAGFDGAVRALAFDSQGKLYAGGEFTSSGGAEVSRIASWSGTTWEPIGEGLDADHFASVHSIVFYDGKLTVGGTFHRSGSNVVESLASWNGSEWVAVGGGIRDGEGSMATAVGLGVRGKELYVTGSIALVGPETNGESGKQVSHIAMWNGSTWSDLGGGLADIGETIVVGKDYFWVGGGFTFAGDQGSYNVARYWLDE